MSDSPIPDLAELMAMLPQGVHLHFDRSQITVAETVTGVSQTNSRLTEASARDIGWLLNFLPSGLPGLNGIDGWLAGPESNTTRRIPIEQARSKLGFIMEVYRTLVTWCEVHDRDDRIVAALDSLSRLAFCLKEIDPEALFDLFHRVEPSLKVAGDFNLMMRFGLMVEEACARSDRYDRQVIERQTQATTCAKAWVFQRIGHLKDAEAQLVVDEELNLSAGETRGLAFTLKCRGRLRRLMAERSDYTPSGESVRLKLAESLTDLERAREEFTRVDVADVRLQQVADTDALIARTHLVAGDLEAARQSLARSELFRSSAQPKTVLDCDILRDEIEFAIQIEAANGAAVVPSFAGIDDVLAQTGGDNFSANEIRGRAFFARAKMKALIGKPFETDAAASIEVYEALGDLNSAAQVRWFCTMNAERDLFAESLIRALERRPPVVRMRALDIYVDAHGMPELTAPMNRPREATDPWWISAIDSAEIEVIRETRKRW